jgi:hypothetical protein
MKVSEANYNKIKTAITHYAKVKGVNAADLTIGEFFGLHGNATLIKQAPEAYPRWFVDGKPIFEKDETYELYPDDSNDNSMTTVYKRFIKEAKAGM